MIVQRYMFIGTVWTRLLHFPMVTLESQLFSGSCFKSLCSQGLGSMERLKNKQLRVSLIKNKT